MTVCSLTGVHSATQGTGVSTTSHYVKLTTVFQNVVNIKIDNYLKN